MRDKWNEKQKSCPCDTGASEERKFWFGAGGYRWEEVMRRFCVWFPALSFQREIPEPSSASKKLGFVACGAQLRAAVLGNADGKWAGKGETLSFLVP